jgi:membrane protein DedA with SNARE-associated domain
MDRRWASEAIWCEIWLVTGYLAGGVLTERPTGALVAQAVIILGGAVVLWKQWQ